MTSFLVTPGIVAVLGFLIYFLYFRNNAGPNLPPGPKPLPIVGNILDLPPPGTPEYQHWLKFKDNYGDISSVTVMGKTIIIIQDREVASELLEKMSAKTSGRPTPCFAGELCHYGKHVGTSQNDATWRKYRRFLHQQMGTRAAVSRFDNNQNMESRRFLLRVLDDPKNFVHHLKTQAGSMILRTVYGYSTEPDRFDPMVSLAALGIETFTKAYAPLAWLVDIIPALKHLPNGFPGTAFKETARKYAKIGDMVINVPYSFARRQVTNGTHQQSFLTSFIQKIDQSEEEFGFTEDIVKWAASSMYIAGLDTSVSSLTSFFMAMAMFPEVQRKAQEEIDSVVGTDRLPTLEDRDSGRMPYVDALVKEVHRWLPVGPMSLAHVADEDIVCRGYRIPKGAYLLVVIWWLCHDPQVHSDPSSFNPDRYLEPRNEPDPQLITFGFGRRRCAGHLLVKDNLFLTISQTLATFTISKAVDKQGRPIEIKPELKPGLVACPVEFECKITPRSAKHVELIHSVKLDYPQEKGDADLVDIDAELMELAASVRGN